MPSYRCTLFAMKPLNNCEMKWLKVSKVIPWGVAQTPLGGSRHRCFAMAASRL